MILMLFYNLNGENVLTSSINVGASTSSELKLKPLQKVLDREVKSIPVPSDTYEQPSHLPESFDLITAVLFADILLKNKPLNALFRFKNPTRDQIIDRLTLNEHEGIVGATNRLKNAQNSLIDDEAAKTCIFAIESYAEHKFDIDRLSKFIHEISNISSSDPKLIAELTTSLLSDPSIYRCIDIPTIGFINPYGNIRIENMHSGIQVEFPQLQAFMGLLDPNITIAERMKETMDNLPENFDTKNPHEFIAGVSRANILEDCIRMFVRHL